MRVTKEYDERREEIIKVADGLFLEEGYDKCTVNAIIIAVGIAKGTFYHYFKSKEEVLDAVIDRHMKRLNESITTELDQFEGDLKLRHVFLSMKMTDEINEEQLKQLHSSENIRYHQKLMIATLKEVGPILSQVIEEGNGHHWQCEHPKECAQIFLSSALMLTDDEMDDGSIDQATVIKVLIETLEKMLNVEAGRFLNQL